MRLWVWMVCVLGCGGPKGPASSEPAPSRTVDTAPAAQAPVAEAPSTTPPSDEPPRDECGPLPWQERKACWARHGIWPHAPALTEQEWSSIDIKTATLEQVRALLPRAVTGDVCAAVNSHEPDKWKRWSPALPVEANMGIWVVEGEGAYEKLMAWHEGRNSSMPVQGVERCGARSVYWGVGGGDDYAVDGIKDDIQTKVRLHVVEAVGFPITDLEDIGDVCFAQRMWKRRCLLMLRRSQLRVCPGSPYEHPEKFVDFCREISRTLAAH